MGGYHPQVALYKFMQSNNMDMPLGQLDVFVRVGRFLIIHKVRRYDLEEYV